MFVQKVQRHFRGCGILPPFPGKENERKRRREALSNLR